MHLFCLSVHWHCGTAGLSCSVFADLHSRSANAFPRHSTGKAGAQRRAGLHARV